MQSRLMLWAQFTDPPANDGRDIPAQLASSLVGKCSQRVSVVLATAGAVHHVEQHYHHQWSWQKRCALQGGQPGGSYGLESEPLQVSQAAAEMALPAGSLPHSSADLCLPNAGI